MEEQYVCTVDVNIHFSDQITYLGIDLETLCTQKCLFVFNVAHLVDFPLKMPAL